MFRVSFVGEFEEHFAGAGGWLHGVGVVFGIAPVLCPALLTYRTPAGNATRSGLLYDRFLFEVIRVLSKSH